VARRILFRMGTKSRERIYGASIRAAAERAKHARKEADRLAVAAWNARMLGFQGPAQPSPALGDHCRMMPRTAHHQPVAVVLDFVDPERAGRWPRHHRRLARFDEAGRQDHGRRMGSHRFNRLAHLDVPRQPHQ
jgi:hypothetical protein